MDGSRRAASFGVVLAFALIGCAVGADAPGAAARCQSGTSAVCTCLDGTLSTQACGESGTVLGVCACNPMPAPPGATPSAAAASSAAQPTSTSTSTPEPASAAPAENAPAPPSGASAPPSFPFPNASGSQPSSANGWPAVPADGSVPDSEHCAPVASWNPLWTSFEEDVLALTNERRAQGASCGDYGDFEPAEPLTMNTMLRCSSRLHSLDMGVNGYFAHDNLDGEDPFDRMAAAGYAGFTMGENIAKGQQTPDEVVEGWMNSPGHCSNIMNPQYTEIGVGYFEGASDSARYNDNKLWTQNFGAPRPSGRCARGQSGC